VILLNREPTLVLVTPVLNQVEFIEETICSVLEQNYGQLYYVVIDGGSTDGTVRVIEKYSPRLSDWVTENDGGQSAAINKGWRWNQDAELYGWLNGDDCLLPGAIKRLAKEYQLTTQQEHRCGLIVGSGFKIARDGSCISVVDVENRTKHCMDTAQQFLQPSSFLTRYGLEQSGYLNEELHYAMDWDLILKVSKKSDVVFVPHCFSAIRMYEETKTSTGGWARLAEIAAIGRSQRGILDRNYLLFRLYSALLYGGRRSRMAVTKRRYKMARLLQTLLNKIIAVRSHMIHW